MDEITLKALAKINLGLDVIRRREDGYHEVSMVMQTIHLYDRLEIAKSHEPGIHIRSNLNFLPVNENNLVYKAGKLLMDEFGITDGVDVNLEKRIPVAAGMAGGSTDAASMLYGIGEKLSQLPPMVKCPVLIAKPSVSVSTKFVYQNLKLDENTNHPDIDALISAIKKKDFPEICTKMGNVLESVTIPNYPVIAEIKEKMMEAGAAHAMMSGSGPTVFGLFEDEETAQRARDVMKASGLARQVYLTSIYNNRRK